METIKLRYTVLQQALLTLEEGILEIERLSPDNSVTYRLMRDGSIQRFEYCIDSFWKFLKMYLENIPQMSVESVSPRAILRTAMDIALITDDECRILLVCVTDRNLTSHSYNELMAKAIQQHIPLYYKTMKGVIDRLDIQ